MALTYVEPYVVDTAGSFTVGNIATGNVVAANIITTSGLYWANGRAFVSGASNITVGTRSGATAIPLTNYAYLPILTQSGNVSVYTA